VQLFAAQRKQTTLQPACHGPEIAEKFHDATAPHPLRLLFPFSTTKMTYMYFYDL
jgi:hypothetical protein